MVRCRWKWVVLWSLWAARLVRQPTPELLVSTGLLRGQVAHDGSHISYLAVPYATVPPEDRFQAPKPQPRWEGIKDAFNEHIKCTQRYTSSSVSGQEDCLTLNVYVPMPTRKNRPVMVFIHGGGFRDGSGSLLLYGPDYLMKHDVILVTFNYRLEVLGYLCLGIPEAHGNAGLKDQVEALKWVKRNIKAFGGDPDNVTIFGESAGSSSVMYHLLSPMSKGLFHKAIMQSGSAFSHWAFQYEPLRTAILLAKQMGYDTEDPKEIYKIFMTKTAEELLSTRVPRKDGDVVLSENIFVPCVEEELPGMERFLSDTPYNLLSKGLYNKVPIIIGYNNAEGYMFAGKENDTTIAKMEFYNALPRDLDFLTDKEKVETAEKLKNMYMGDEEITKETLVKFSRYAGDSAFRFSVTKTIELLLETTDQPVYSYRFQYDGWMNLPKLIFGFWSAPGATHADDLFYLFKPRITFVMSFFETDMINTMTSMWTNFAKFGKPTLAGLSTKLDWRPTEKTDPRLLVIDKQFSSAPLWDDTMRFWNSTYSKYRRKITNKMAVL